MRLAFFLGLFLLALASETFAAGVEEDYERLVAAEQAAHRQPARECDQSECRRWWWREVGDSSFLAVEHVKNADSRRVLALCWRAARGDDDMRCLSSAGRSFAVAAIDAAHWRDAYFAANRGAPVVMAQALDLSCAAPVVAKGDPSPGRNPVVGVRIRVADGSWSIRFALADGRAIDRADQYRGEVLSPAALAKSNANARQPAIGQWIGLHRRKSDVVMIGSLYQDGPGAFHYLEVVASTQHPDDSTIMVAKCQSTLPVAVAAPPAGPAVPPPASTPAEPPATPEPAMVFTAASNEDCLGCWTLTASGKILPDSDRALAQALKEQAALNHQVTIVRLSSPGGAVSAALAMGRMVRAAGLKTLADQICASACALVFMGGATRHAAPMMLGVHQFSSTESAKLNGATSMAVSQIQISELLAYAKEMGIDSEVIGIASATPPDEMHFFGATELLALGLNTKQAGVSPGP